MMNHFEIGLGAFLRSPQFGRVHLGYDLEVPNEVLDELGTFSRSSNVPKMKEHKKHRKFWGGWVPMQHRY